VASRRYDIQNLLKIEKINFSKTTEKITLTPEQENRVRTIYNNDISLWESLQN
jgi:hypothetical protein